MKRFKRELLKAFVMGIIIFVVLQSVVLVTGGEVRWNHDLVISFLYTIMYSMSLYFANSMLFIALDRIFRHDRFNVKRLAIGFITSFTVTVFVIFLLRIVIEVIINRHTFTEFLRDENPSNYVVSIIIFFFVSLFVHSFYFYRSYQENKVKEQKIIAGTASAKFESLKNQIDPHFLFNSLNVLSSLIEENPENAQKFTTSLSKVYRYVLEQKDKELISVEEELSFAKTYMNLLKMRFENSLFYELPESIPDADSKVVPLSLQLLLENTVKHNVASEQRPLHIKIFIEDNYLVVRNDFQKKEVLQDRQGVGLQNIFSRYGIVTRRKVLVEQDKDTFTVKIPILTRQISMMETEYNNQENSYYKAQKRVEDIKGFYGNLTSYIIVIIGLAALNFYTSPQYYWFLFPAIGWGIGVLIHGLAVFNYLPFLGRDWEEKKIRQLMEQERSDEWN